MAWIRVIQENEAEGELRKLYSDYRAPWGGVDNVLKIHSVSPKALTPHMDLYRVIMFGPSALSRPQREMIGIVVSVSNGCQYCVSHHGDALYRLKKDKPLVRHLRVNYREAPINSRDKLMLDFAVALTLKPQDNFECTVEQLRAEGFTDEAIHDIAIITAYFNFVNRIVQGLGVELEHYWNAEGFSHEDLPMAHDRRDE